MSVWEIYLISSSPKNRTYLQHWGEHFPDYKFVRIWEGVGKKGPCPILLALYSAYWFSICLGLPAIGPEFSFIFSKCVILWVYLFYNIKECWSWMGAQRPLTCLPCFWTWQVCAAPTGRPGPGPGILLPGSAGPACRIGERYLPSSLATLYAGLQSCTMKEDR